MKQIISCSLQYVSVRVSKHFAWPLSPCSLRCSDSSRQHTMVACCNQSCSSSHSWVSWLVMLQPRYQELATIAVEIDNHFDGSLVSQVHIHRFLHAVPPHLGTKSSGAVPFMTMFAQLVLWFGFSVPLVFLGAYFAVRRIPVELPVRTNHIPPQIPKQLFVTSPSFCYLSVALCHLVLCTRSCSSSCHPCGNISSIESSVTYQFCRDSGNHVRKDVHHTDVLPTFPTLSTLTTISLLTMVNLVAIRF